ncbi:MAG: glycosyltransferase family 1 protein [Microcella sp.]|nr:glycosyltransferase family 1 protein [Microcella sp.]
MSRAKRRSTSRERDARVRVLIDATAMPIDRGGVARYVDELVRALDADLVVVCQPRDEQRYRDLAPDAVIVVGPRALSWRGYRLLWEQVSLPRVARRHDVDAVHSPHYTTPLFMARPRVVTVHDVTFFTEPELHRPVKRWFFTTWIRISLRVADEIIAPSRATAIELERATGFRADDVLVAHHGVDHDRFSPPDDSRIDAVLTRHSLNRPYVLFLGTIEPRKNVPALIRAHATLAVERPDAPLLVLAGARGWETGVDAALAEHPRPDLVRRLGYVDADDVVPLLGGADIVAYPSKGEGFGLPVLEAMASGAVVLTTRRLAIPEVAVDGAAYGEPEPDDLARMLRLLLDDAGERRRIRTRALERAAAFSWSESAAAHLVAYRSAASLVPSTTGSLRLPRLDDSPTEPAH